MTDPILEELRRRFRRLRRRRAATAQVATDPTLEALRYRFRQQRRRRPGDVVLQIIQRVPGAAGNTYERFDYVSSSCQ